MFKLDYNYKNESGIPKAKFVIHIIPTPLRLKPPL